MKALITGSRGFLGRHVVAAFRARGVEFVETGIRYDLTDRQVVRHLFAETRPDVVIHLAAKCGGIGANQQRPGEFFHDNMLMGMNVLEGARRSDVQKVVLVGTVCSYPKHTPVPFREDDLWKGYPEETNAPYGVAKRALMVMADAYRRQYGLKTVSLILANLYGPGDSFDLERSHVIPAMIRKYYEACRDDADSVTLWGTGSPTREFLFVEDAARAVISAAERYEGADPINIGTGQEISMRELARTIAGLFHFHGETRWDRARPDGQPRRCLDVTRAYMEMGWKSETGLIPGLTRTIRWYGEHADEIEREGSR